MGIFFLINFYFNSQTHNYYHYNKFNIVKMIIKTDVHFFSSS